MNTFVKPFLFLFSFIIISACSDSSSDKKEAVSNETFEEKPSSQIADNSPPTIEKKKTNQQTLSLPQTDKTHWWQDAITYQVWVRSFQDSDGDGHGDLNGITSRLDYLADLGVNTLWLSPIFDSPSYHGFDTSDFYKVHPDFGSISDFESLVEKAKEKNIRIILDIALNHVSEYSSWFEKALVGDKQYQNYFVWSDTLPEGYGKAWSDTANPAAVWHKKPEREDYYYGVFGWTQPDLNYNNPKVVEEVKNIAKFWLEKGAEGFRLDAIRYLYEESGGEGQRDTQATHAFWKDFTQHVKKINPNAFLIGEALTNTKSIGAYYQEGKGIDATFDFGFNHVVAGSFDRSLINQESDPSIKAQHERAIKRALWEVYQRRLNNDIPAYFFGTFLNGHDSDRLAMMFDGNIAQQRIAASLLLTAPYAPYLYYGEEIGMLQKNLGDDMYRRALMQWDSSSNAGFNQTNKRWLDNPETFYWLENFTPWWKNYWQAIQKGTVQSVKAQQDQPDSLLNHYKTLIKIRNENPILRAPDSIHLFDNDTSAWVVRNNKGKEDLWVIINLNPDSSTTFELPGELTGDFTNLISQQPLNLAERIILDKGQVMILRKDL